MTNFRPNKVTSAPLFLVIHEYPLRTSVHSFGENINKRVLGQLKVDWSINTAQRQRKSPQVRFGGLLNSQRYYIQAMLLYINMQNYNLKFLKIKYMLHYDFEFL